MGKLRREIKFKGYSELYKRWVYGFYSETKEGCFISGKYKKGQPVEVAPESVGQYVGVSDLNKVDVYEGDIVRYANFVNWQNFGEIGDIRNLGEVIFDDSGYNCNYGFCIKMLELVYNSSYNTISKAEPLNVTNATWGLEVVDNVYFRKTKEG